MKKNFKENAIDGVNKKQSAGLINLSFDEKRVFPNEEKGTVAVETVSFIYPKVNHLKHLDVYGFDPLNTVGVAKVAPGDKFDEKRGYLIASSRSENVAYQEAIKYLKELKLEAKQILDAAENRIEILKDCIEHNKQFIDDVSNGK